MVGVIQDQILTLSRVTPISECAKLYKALGLNLVRIIVTQGEVEKSDIYHIGFFFAKQCAFDTRR